MFKFLITYDNKDKSLGGYLNECFNDLSDHLKYLKYQQAAVSLSSGDCTREMIKTHTEGYGTNKFMFTAYTHGTQNSLTVSKKPFVDFDNAINFRNSFFYTCACLTAVELGPELQRQGCLAYIGYKDKVEVLLKYSDIFRKCKNSGIKYFLETGKKLEEAVMYMKKVYDEEVQKLAEGTDGAFIAAACLHKNRRSLEFLGDGELILDDFIVK